MSGYKLLIGLKRNGRANRRGAAIKRLPERHLGFPATVLGEEAGVVKSKFEKALVVKWL